MVDNTTYTPGSGATIAADDIGSGVLVQRVKNTYGPDGTATDVDATHALPTTLTDNTNAVSVLKSDGTAAGQNALLSAPGHLSVAYTTTSVQAVASTDAANYAWVAVHINTQGTSSTVTFQGSLDNSTWFSVQLNKINDIPGSSAVSATTGAGLLYAGPLNFRYFRLNVTGISAGTTAGTVWFSASPRTPFVQSVTTTTIPVAFPGANANSSGEPFANASVAAIAAWGFGFNGVSWDRKRVPSIVKTVATQASGNTALWTPASGKKFRLQRIMVQITSDAATSGGADITIDLKDGSSTSTGVTFTVFVPAVAATTFSPGFQIGWLDFGNGVLSAAANNVLNLNLSAALSSGYCRAIVCGTEE